MFFFLRFKISQIRSLAKFDRFLHSRTFTEKIIRQGERTTVEQVHSHTWIRQLRVRTILFLKRELLIVSKNKWHHVVALKIYSSMI